MTNAQHALALLSRYPEHYSTSGLQGATLSYMKRLKQRVLSEWAEDLADMPEWAVLEACKAWRTGEKGMFRPHVADILGICRMLLAPFKANKERAQRELEAAEAEARRNAYFEHQRRQQWGAK